MLTSSVLHLIWWYLSVGYLLLWLISILHSLVSSSTTLSSRDIGYLWTLPLLGGIVITAPSMYATYTYVEGMHLLLLISTYVVTCLWISTSPTLWGYIRSECYLLMGLSLISMTILILSTDIFIVYLLIEWQGLCIYSLIVSCRGRDVSLSTEAAIKYFISSTVASSIYLLGVGLIYGMIGSTNLYTIGIIFPSLDMSGISTTALSISLLVLLLFKVAAAPFHIWSPEVYSSAYLPLTAFIAIVPKLSIVGVLFTLQETWPDTLHTGVLSFISIISILIGGYGGLLQVHLIKLLAYSSIGHTGFILGGFLSSTVGGISSSFLYLSIYIVMSISIYTSFLTLLVPKEDSTYGTMSTLHELQYSPIPVKLLLSIILFSMAGIPPLAGFFVKVYLLYYLIECNNYYTTLLFLIGSLLSLYYYLRVVKTMF